MKKSNLNSLISISFNNYRNLSCYNLIYFGNFGYTLIKRLKNKSEYSYIKNKLNVKIVVYELEIES